MHLKKNCALCNSADLEIIYDLISFRSMVCLPGIVFVCKSCGMSFKSFENDIIELYSGEYIKSDNLDIYMDGEEARKLFKKILSRSKFITNFLKKPRLLDLGTGAGTMLEVAENLGFEAEGIEICPELVNKAKRKGVSVNRMRIEEIKIEKKFEVITMMDIIEHLPDPMFVLNSIKHLLVPGGELLVYTPNHKSLSVKIAKLLYLLNIKKPVEDILADKHVSFFDDKTLQLSLEKAGFYVRDMIITPYNPLRKGPSNSFSFLELFAVSFIEYVGYLIGRLGFRCLAYAELIL